MRAIKYKVNFKATTYSLVIEYFKRIYLSFTDFLVGFLISRNHYSVIFDFFQNIYIIIAVI
jgi:hypothetical protein